MMCHWRYVLDNLFGRVRSVSCIGVTHIPKRWDEAGHPYAATAVRRVLDHIRKQGYEIVEAEPDAATRMRHPKLARITVDRGYNASRTSMDLPISLLVLRTAESARGPVVKLPTMGGSVPLYMIEEILHAPTITVPIVNHDNNQHSFNENLRIQNLWDGIELMAALLAM